MARTNITVRELDGRNTFLESFTTLTEAVNGTSLEAEFEMKDRDDKYLILVQNGASSAGTVTVLRGNGLQGTADLMADVAPTGYTIVTLESGCFKQVSGDDKGKVILKGGNSNIKLAVFKLP